MADGWIKIDRKLLKWGWYSDNNTKAVFLDILLNANFRDGEYRGVKVHAGECVIGRKQMAERLGMSEQNVRTALKHLKETGEISTIKSTNRFTVVRIEKWMTYQVEDGDINQQIVKQSTNNQPSANHQLTINQPTANHIQEGKKVRREESNNSYYSESEKKRRARELDEWLYDAERKKKNGLSADDNDRLR